jgi:hypothetical protein
MSAKRPLSSVFRADERKDQQRNQPFDRQKSSRKKATTIFLCCLALFFLLATSSSSPFFGQNPNASPTPFPPVGNATIIVAPGFDTCVAPPADLLETWWNESPYQWLNVYLGGVSMFPTCGGKNLTPGWVRTVYNQGWSLLPTWVGPQAPCAVQHTVMSTNAAVSYAQGQDEADAASESASRLGFSSSAPIYFDMEHFNPTRPNGSRDTICIQAVNAFLDGWSYELTAQGRIAGVYASASNYPMLVGSTPMSAPAAVWIAGGSSWTTTYNSQCTVYGNKYISDNDWNADQRIYQYTGGHKETYGQQSWNIDSDCADAPMVGHITTMSLVVPSQFP